MILLEKLKELQFDGWVNLKQNVEKTLWLSNYTQKTQFESYWNYWTLMSRGLILDNSGKIISHGLDKFFNFEEFDGQSKILDLKPKWILSLDTEIYISDKLDGSCGIGYIEPQSEQFRIATRGSFDSEQARWATKFFHENYDQSIIDPDLTYVFEIIYPQNKIVVDYCGESSLKLIAVNKTETQESLELQQFVKFFDVNLESKIGQKIDFNELKSLNKKNSEGFVIRYFNPTKNESFRVKIKFEEYLRLHRILSNISDKSIWNSICDLNGEIPDEFLSNIPDEFFDKIKSIQLQVNAKFYAKKHKIEEFTRKYKREYLTKKELAQELFRTENLSDIRWALFKTYDDQSVEDLTEQLFNKIKK